VSAAGRGIQAQNAERSEPFSDGATGHHEILVRVE
jgi:hypothetical protein